jgi:CTP-dependent riboflavin kinase
MKILRGKVVKEVGGLSHWMRKLESDYSSKTGVKLFPGTLHIKLENPLHLPVNAHQLKQKEIEAGTSLNMLPCYLNGIEVFLLQTDQQERVPENYPLTIIEITADTDLIKSLSISNGDEVEVAFPMIEGALVK